jgi:hypothetical protein
LEAPSLIKALPRTEAGTLMKRLLSVDVVVEDGAPAAQRVAGSAVGAWEQVVQDFIPL